MQMHRYAAGECLEFETVVSYPKVFDERVFLKCLRFVPNRLIVEDESHVNIKFVKLNYVEQLGLLLKRKKKHSKTNKELGNNLLHICEQMQRGVRL
jgi:hypothetical protein